MELSKQCFKLPWLIVKINCLIFVKIKIVEILKFILFIYEGNEVYDAYGGHIFFSSTTVWVPWMELRFSGMVTGSYTNLAEPSYWIQMCPSSIWVFQDDICFNKLVITEMYSWVLWVLVIKFQTWEGGSCWFLFEPHLARRMGNPQTKHFLLIVARAVLRGEALTPVGSRVNCRYSVS